MNIGMICTTAHKEPVKLVLATLADRMKKSGKYHLFIFHSFEDLYHGTKNDSGARSIFDVINYDALDAMIIEPGSLNDKTVVTQAAERCAAHHVPLISIDDNIEGAFRVYFGYGTAFSNIVEHVITEHGCRRIKLFAGFRNNDFSQTRIDSCKAVMERHGLELKEKDIMYGDFWEQPTYAAMDEFFASGEPLPEAFICCNDSMAMAVCLKLAEKGFKVPDDVLVTGFDGIEMEKYHNPRLCTAVVDYNDLADAIFSILNKLSEDKKTAPFETELHYTPVFSESCGCKKHNAAESNRTLSEVVRSYAYARTFEEHMDNMENEIAVDPTPEKVRTTLHQYGLGNSVLCVTESFRKLFDGNAGSDENECRTYPQKMTVFASVLKNNSGEDEEFDSLQLLPDVNSVFGEYNSVFVLPVHFQDAVIGYIVTPYVSQEHYNEYLYTFSMTVNRCMETMRIHEHMLALNTRLSFLFTHDQLTGIYNRYGFYNKFREKSELGANRDVFIVSADLNDMKYINDNFGHSAGDDALTITANALKEAAEGDENTICSRFGGDEFVVARICDGDAEERGKRYHELFDRALKTLNETSGKPFTVYVSIGVYSASLAGVDNVDSLIELSDRLMYNDKARYKRVPRNGPNSDKSRT